MFGLVYLSLSLRGVYLLQQCQRVFFIAATGGRQVANISRKKKSNFFFFEKILKLKRRQMNNQNVPTFVNVLLDLLTSFQKPNRATMVSIYTNTQAHEQ